MNGLRDFVPGQFPLPWMPVFDGMGEFVPGGFPLPQNPVFYPSKNGSLPKAPDMPMALIGNGNGATLDDCGGGMGCGCQSCGMGALTGDTLIPQASLPSFLQGDSWITGVPTLYIAGGALLVTWAMFMNAGPKSSYRRRNPTRKRNPSRRRTRSRGRR